ncbi:lysozyme inhibitor LprI family protein [Paraglaciecola mesophila]|uniref:Lysozyme inhibitor LprI family protein n=1 Tax=Paraglaciecola mesophila TaxID=197222 RepID=A0ABU9SSJ4_9ALTE
MNNQNDLRLQRKSAFSKIFTPLTLKLGCATFLMLTASSTFSASFNCQNASQTDEKVVCGSVELSTLDEQLSKRYKVAIASNQAQPAKKFEIQRSQTQWLSQRKACHFSFDCIKSVYRKRINALIALSRTENAFSWGGNYRLTPSTSATRLGSARERQPIKVLSQTDVIFNGYPWFQIEINGQEAYQWGGIICDPHFANTTFCE